MIQIPTREVVVRFNQGDKEIAIDVPFGSTIAEILECNGYPRQGHEVWRAEIDGEMVPLDQAIVEDCRVTIYNVASLVEAGR